ncbi:hypothetical protein BDV32DRAFT_62518 [Aspergillus pseudonomiae]|uniref:Uncharacterized protein n=1 Tax=Aspergillus pseudonomiae TaxID=1506151 RepID=A0A5N7D2A3_9EURO|nr:uncharacterized protein BDV37DRAFT_286543 [Aspergillus pseudonomiae]KAB8265036.1 hypothetical protein BDV32DRAFT_62518 [Aspergillus pseudonomiae]KAE8400536.1 hypothetical protein BDV37DRAFT_286543 [Aspergillus pseudonomiae]
MPSEASESDSPVSSSPSDEPIPQSDDQMLRADGLRLIFRDSVSTSLEKTGGSNKRRISRQLIWALNSDWYVWEILALILSAATLIAIIVILAKFDQQPQPSWKHVSLNSVISWLSTISKGCVLYAISEALGQLKWAWFAQGTRPMSNFRTFDAASRGFYGSGELIWTLRFRHFAVWGSFAVILALAFDPFTQNLIHYFPNSVYDSSQRAFLANSTYYNTTGPPLQNDAIVWVDPSLKANVYNSLFNNDQSKPWATPKYICSTSNCTWGPTAAIEVRARCSDVTDLLNTTCTTITDSPLGYTGITNCSATLPLANTTAWFLSGMDVLQPLSIATVHASTALIHKNATLSPIQMVVPTNLTMKTMLTENTTKWHATECSIQPVVHSFNATVKDNIYTETTIDTWEKSRATWDSDTESNLSTGMYFEPPWGLEQGINSNTSFMFSGLAVSSLDTFFQGLFTGVWFMRSAYSSSFLPGPLDMYAAPDFLRAMAIGNITGCDMGSMDKLQCAMENVAAAVTKSFRDSAYIGADSDPVGARMAAGRAMASMTFVEVRWPWIVLPGLVWVLGVATLLGTMWKSRKARAPKWRNDPVPLLFLFRGQGYGVGVSESEAEERAESLRVKLDRSNGRMVLS